MPLTHALGFCSLTTKAADTRNNPSHSGDFFLYSDSAVNTGKSTVPGEWHHFLSLQ